MTASRAFYPIAVIELGTSSIRMAIGETDGASTVRTLEDLVQGVSLGKDTFTTREIQRGTLQKCVDVLKSYRRKLKEYHLTNPSHIRVVATSAIREASNRMAILDRIYSATGFIVEPIDEAEISRVTYLGIRPMLERQPELRDAQTMLMEVGGGNTEILFLKGQNIVHARSYRLGSLRMQQMTKQYDVGREQAVAMVHGQIDRTLEELRDVIPQHGKIELLALGGDMRFAAKALKLEPSMSGLLSVPVRDLQRFTDQLSQLSIERIMLNYHLELSEAETLLPALLANVRMAKMLNVERMLVTGFNLRDALLHGVLRPADWSDAFRDQIVHSAEDYARKFMVDLDHARHVADLARDIFRYLKSEHQMDDRYETILNVGALLHEAGLFITRSGYHKHSYYLIRHSEIFGLDALDHHLVALTARYHRRAAPKPSHEAYASLDRNSRVVLSRLAGILRVAIALAQSRTQRIRKLKCSLERNRLVLHAKGPSGDLSMEQLELRQQSGLFRDAFGFNVLLRETST
ncbi:MAG: exopolyphosphatase [Fuerstiella sp.]